MAIVEEDLIIRYKVSSDIDEFWEDVERGGKTLKEVVEQQKKFMEQLSTLRAGIRDINAARLAVEQLARGIRTANPSAFIYALLNIIQVIATTAQLLRWLQTQAALTGSALAIVQFLQGPAGWAVIAGAIVAAGTIYAAASRSMQRGGLVEETGPYLLHRGELVVPAAQVANFTSFGPFTMVVNSAPSRPEDFMREWSWKVASELRRGGGI